MNLTNFISWSANWCAAWEKENIVVLYYVINVKNHQNVWLSYLEGDFSWVTDLSGWHAYGLLQRADRKYDEAIKCYRNALKWEKVSCCNVNTSMSNLHDLLSERFFFESLWWWMSNECFDWCWLCNGHLEVLPQQCSAFTVTTCCTQSETVILQWLDSVGGVTRKAFKSSSITTKI